MGKQQTIALCKPSTGGSYKILQLYTFTTRNCKAQLMQLSQTVSGKQPLLCAIRDKKKAKLPKPRGTTPAQAKPIQRQNKVTERFLRGKWLMEALELKLETPASKTQYKPVTQLITWCTSHFTLCPTPPSSRGPKSSSMNP